MPQLFSTKNLLLSTRPLCVGVVSDPLTLETALSWNPPERLKVCDLFELRLDLLGLETAELRAAIPRLELPILLTARHPAEGGQGTEAPEGRLALLEPVLDLASLLDVELRSALELKGLRDRARSLSIGVIGSFHDFQATPGEEVLNGAIDMAQTFGFDAVKLATFLNGPDDLIRLMKLLIGPRRLPMSLMGMGGLGRLSRLTLSKLGSLLNYGYLGASNAPGQWPAAQLKELLSEL